MKLQIIFNYLFSIIFGVDILLITIAFVSTLFNQELLVGLGYLTGYAAYFVIAPVCILFFIYLLLCFFRNKDIFNDFLFRINILLFVGAILLNQLYFYYLRQLT